MNEMISTHVINCDSHEYSFYILFIHSEATKAGLDVECTVEDDLKPSAECADYEEFVSQLSKIRNNLQEQDNSRKATLVDALKKIKITPMLKKDKVDTNSAELDAALKAAKEATAKHGITSSEARLAWETYEEIASAGLDNAMGVGLDEECDLESGEEACKAIEALNNILPVLQVAVEESKSK